MRSPYLIAMLPLLFSCSTEPAPDPGAPPAAPGTPPAQPEAPGVTVPPVTGLHLQALVATSGDGVERLLDGDPTTGWSPASDAVDEGVLLRFEEPTRVLEAKLQLCPESTAATFQSYVNGAENTRVRVNPGGPVLIPWREQMDTPAVKSLFVRILGSDGPVDICEIAVTLPPEQTQAVAPPRAVPATVQATSVLEPCEAYHTGYLFDGRTDFGWVEGAEGLGVGEKLILDFGGAIEITGFDIWNGYQRSPDHFQRNARLAKLGLSVDGAEPMAIAVADTQGPQRIDLPAPVTGKRFELKIAEAVAGTSYEDLVISELRLRDASGPFGLVTADLEKKETELLDKLVDHELGTAVNTTWVGLCNELDRLTLRSNHSFVAYTTLEEGPDDEIREVFDGAWVLRELAAPSTIQTFGRRHRTLSTWMPYGDDQVQTTVKIAGGKSQLWLHDHTAPAPAAELLKDQSFAAEHAYCQQGTAWLEQDMGELLFIKGSALAGIYRPF